MIYHIKNSHKVSQKSDCLLSLEMRTEVSVIKFGNKFESVL